MSPAALSFLADRLALARQMRDQSQAELASASGVPQPTISKIENRGIADPSLAAVASLAEALGLSLSALVDPDPQAFAQELEAEVRGRPLDGEPRTARALSIPAGRRDEDWAASLLGYDGSVLAVCTSERFVIETAKQRAKLEDGGRIAIFDPYQAVKKRLPTGAKKVGWSPLLGCEEISQARRVSEALLDVTLGEGGGSMAFFRAMSQQVLPVLLYAAAVMDEDMRRVIRWLYRSDDEATIQEVDSILRWKEDYRPLDAWSGFVGKEPKLRGDIIATVASALVPYEDELLQKAMIKKPLDNPFSEKDTLYVVVPPERLRDSLPVLELYLQTLLEPALTRSLPEPLLIVIDDVAGRAGVELPERLRPLLGAAKLATVW